MGENSTAKFIFNKYAGRYQEKYMDLDLYADTLNKGLELLNNKKIRVLDLGCGPGNISKYLLERNPDLDILGIDISENMISLASKNNPEAQYKVMDIRELDSLDDRFDAIFSGFLLPYLKPTQVQKLFEDMQHLLLPGGLLYLSTMVAENKHSDLQVPSSGDRDILITYYHTHDFLKMMLKNNHFETSQTNYIKNPGNPKGVMDLVIIAVKPPNA